MGEKNYQAVSYVRPIFKDLLCPEDNDPPISEKLSVIQKYLEQFPDIAYIKNITDRSLNSQSASLRGIERLIPLFEEHICDCLVLYSVREFSNYIQETQHCLLELLPSLSVRILSVCDDYDSITSGDATDGYPLLTDLLAKAESNENGRKRKVEMIRKYENRRASRYLCPYGYQLRQEDETSIVIDPEAAPIVQRIFTEYVSGKPPKQIAKSLTRENVLSPRGKKTAQDPESPPPANYWTEVKIKAILSNEFYTGDLILPGYRKTMYLNPQDMEIYNAAPEMMVNHHHPAIISRETFDTAQFMFNAEFSPGKLRMKRNDTPDPDPYCNLVFCSNCGAKMLHDRRLKSGGTLLQLFYTCSRSKRQGRELCSRKVIPFTVVDMAAHTALKQEAALADALAIEFEARGCTVYREKESEHKNAMDNLVQELREITLELSRLHAEYMAGRLPADQYYLQTESLEEASEHKSADLLNAMTTLREFRTRFSPESNAWMQLYHGLSFDKPLTHTDGKRLIERILVSPEDSTVTVQLKCAEEKALFRSMLDNTPAKAQTDAASDGEGE